MAFWRRDIEISRFIKSPSASFPATSRLHIEIQHDSAITASPQLYRFLGIPGSETDFWSLFPSPGLLAKEARKTRPFTYACGNGYRGKHATIRDILQVRSFRVTRLCMRKTDSGSVDLLRGTDPTRSVIGWKIRLTGFIIVIKKSKCDISDF